MSFALFGLAVSPGIAIGRAHLVSHATLEVAQYQLRERDIDAELARFIEFKPFNLMQTHWQLGEAFDIVFCRNVMIYFDAPTQRKVLERIHGVMKPQGKLFVGHSENFTDSRDLFKLRGKTIYERV